MLYVQFIYYFYCICLKLRTKETIDFFEAEYVSVASNHITLWTESMLNGGGKFPTQPHVF